MFKVVVFTSRDFDCENWRTGNDGSPKCIFAGMIPFIPRKNEDICLRDSYACETINSVIYFFHKGYVEITINSCDKHNDYDKVDYSDFLES